MVPYATTPTNRRESHPTLPTPTTYKFPDFTQELQDEHEEEMFGEIARGTTPRPLANGLPNGLHSSERWPLRKPSKPSSWVSWTTAAVGGRRHARQKSLTEAIRTVRDRKPSISEGAQEIADSLKAPVSYKLIILCLAWFSASILTNTSSKAILTALPRPVTLTVMQFFLVTFWCLFLSWLAKRNATIRNAMPVLKNGIRKPSKDVIMPTLPLVAFQIGGHILNSEAMERLPVMLVHAIKGLSPLMTVFAYRAFLHIRYSVPTYLSLIPLTVGVIMACSANFDSNLLGLIYAFGSAILFVTQNIVSKKIFNEAAKAEADGAPISRRKPDKLNLLCYSAGLAFIITFPVWLWSEGSNMAIEYWDKGYVELRIRPGALDHGRLLAEFIFNGTFHFGQSMIAFILLGLVSPVTYSVASLIKRVAVIIFAIIWFGNPVSRIQGIGFILTFLGLYLYDRTSDASKADRRARQKAETSAPLLPLDITDARRSEAPAFMQSPMAAEDMGRRFAGASSYANGEPVGSGPGRPGLSSSNSPSKANGVPISLAAGTRAEQTWNQGDTGKPQIISVR